MNNKEGSCLLLLIIAVSAFMIYISNAGVNNYNNDSLQLSYGAGDNIEVKPTFMAVTEKEGSDDTFEGSGDDLESNAKMGAQAFLKSIFDGSYIKNIVVSNEKLNIVDNVPSGDSLLSIETAIDDETTSGEIIASGDNMASGDLQNNNDTLETQVQSESTVEVLQGPPTNYVKKIYMERVTAYCLCQKCCGKSPSSPGYGRTASGLVIVPNTGMKVIAVDPKIIPLGTKVYVETLNGVDYGYAIAADTGGAIKGYKIDVYMDSHHDALVWGRRNVNVYILADQ